MSQQVNKPSHHNREPELNSIKQSFRQLGQFRISDRHDCGAAPGLCDHLNDPDQVSLAILSHQLLLAVGVRDDGSQPPAQHYESGAGFFVLTVYCAARFEEHLEILE